MTDTECRVRLEEIQVGERCRKDLGNLDDLVASIKEVGLLHPVVISPDKTLIAGRRRLEAVRQLGWSEVPVHVVSGLEDTVKALQAEREENVCRKSFTPSEAAALGRKLEELEKAAAKVRQAQAGPEEGPGQKANGSGKLPEGKKGDTRDKVAEALEMSGKTYEKVKKVVEAAEKEPEKYGHLVKKMDESGKVDGAYRQLPQAGRSQKNKSLPLRKKGRKDGLKRLLAEVMKEVGKQRTARPGYFQAMRGEKARDYAGKLRQVATVLGQWADALSPASDGGVVLGLDGTNCPLVGPLESCNNTGRTISPVQPSPPSLDSQSMCPVAPTGDTTSRSA